MHSLLSSWIYDFNIQFNDSMYVEKVVKNAKAAKKITTVKTASIIPFQKAVLWLKVSLTHLQHNYIHAFILSKNHIQYNVK